jgi:hypothetical protein
MRGTSPSVVDILSMVLIYGLEAVSAACAMALDEQTASSAHVINLLHRAHELVRPPPLQVPEALKLTIEPAANCDRYDALLRVQRLSNLPVPLTTDPARLSFCRCRGRLRCVSLDDQDSRESCAPPGQFWTPIAGQCWAPVDTPGAVTSPIDG